MYPELSHDVSINHYVSGIHGIPTIKRTCIGFNLKPSSYNFISQPLNFYMKINNQNVIKMCLFTVDLRHSQSSTIGFP